MFQLILPIGIIFTSLVAGVIFDKFIYKKLKDFVVKQKIPGSEIIISSLHHTTFIWFALAGCYGALLSYSKVNPDLTDFLRKSIVVVFVYSVTLVGARLTAGFVNLYITKAEGVSTSLFSNIAQTTIFILGTLITLQTVGVQITPILTTLGVSGLAVGLALKDTLENLFAGFYLIISKQIKTGDYVKIDGGYEGYVTDITWRHTTIRELSNNAIIIPNSKLSSNIFTNYHLPIKEVTLTINIGVGYDSDLEHVERVTVKLAKEVMQEVAPELIQDEPYVRYHKFGDFSIDFSVFLKVNDFFDQRLARHIFLKKLHKIYQQEGIKIPSPNVEFYLQGHGIGADSPKM